MNNSNDEALLEAQRTANGQMGEDDLPNLEADRIKAQASGSDEGEAERIRALKLLEQVEGQQEIEKKPDEQVEETPEAKIARLEKALEEAEKNKAPIIDPTAEVDKKLADNNFNQEALAKEYVETGKLSDETLASLKKAGFTEAGISAYIEIKEAQAEKEAQGIMVRTVGSVENYAKLVEWIGANKTEAEIEANNKGVQSGHAEIYIKSMFSDMNKGVNVNQHTVIRGSSQGQGEQSTNSAYKNEGEMMKAMQQSDYGVDPVYTNKVRARVALMN